MRVRIEHGPKGKKQAVYAPDWPGLERGAKTDELALEKLEEYRERYLPIARGAGMEAEFAAEGEIDIVEIYDGPGSTDFWGISFGSAPAEKEQPYDSAEFERHLALLQSSWTFFDEVSSRVTEELKKGPRGGGRDRDHIVRHVLFNEADWARGIGVETSEEALIDPVGRQKYRDDYIAALREYHAAEQMAKKWTLSYLIRHSAYHTLDHAWEMEDKDLTGKY